MIRNALSVYPDHDQPLKGKRLRRCRDCNKTVRYKRFTNLGWLHFCKPYEPVSYAKPDPRRDLASGMAMSRWTPDDVIVLLVFIGLFAIVFIGALR